MLNIKQYLDKAYLESIKKKNRPEDLCEKSGLFEMYRGRAMAIDDFRTTEELRTSFLTTLASGPSYASTYMNYTTHGYTTSSYTNT